MQVEIKAKPLGHAFVAYFRGFCLGVWVASAPFVLNLDLAKSGSTSYTLHGDELLSSAEKASRYYLEAFLILSLASSYFDRGQPPNYRRRNSVSPPSSGRDRCGSTMP